MVYCDSQKKKFGFCPITADPKCSQSRRNRMEIILRCRICMSVCEFMKLTCPDGARRLSKKCQDAASIDKQVENSACMREIRSRFFFSE
jgi:hypothetical protein